MVERKHQRALIVRTALTAPSLSSLTAQQYLELGGALEWARLSAEPGLPLLEVHPRLPSRLTDVKMCRTPLGMLATPLFRVLGWESAIIETALTKLSPWCGQCCQVAPLPIQSISLEGLPSGYVALAVDDASNEDFSLLELAELFGAERAVVDGRLIRIEDHPTASGRPVLHVVPVERTTELQREIESWFERGGRGLLVYHFVSRDGVATEVARLSGMAVCPSCQRQFQPLDVTTIAAREPCLRCRGEGYLLTRDDRLIACGECNGYGTGGELPYYRLGELSLWALPFVTIEAAPDLLQARSSQKLHTSLIRARDCGLGAYPIGACVDLLSSGERAALTILLAEEASVGSRSLIIDGGALGISAESTLGARVFEPAPPARFECLQGADSSGMITLDDISIGPMCAERIEFSVGVPTLVKGPPGSGKSILLRDVLHARFAKRRKLSAVASFGSINSCDLFAVEDSNQCGTVLELLGLHDVVATLVSATRDAKRLGLKQADLIPSQSRYRCSSCGAKPPCPVCHGALFEAVVSELPLGGRQLREVLTHSLSLAQAALWIEEVCGLVLDLVPEEYRSTIALGSSPLEFPPALRRYLFLASRLTRAGSFSQKRSSKQVVGTPGALHQKLILVDGPLGLSDEHVGAVIRIIRDLCARGATVLVSETLATGGEGATLQRAFPKVVSLEIASADIEARTSSPDFTRRISRLSSISC